MTTLASLRARVEGLTGPDHGVNLTAYRLGLKPIPYNPVSGMQVVQKWIVPQSDMWEWADEILRLRAELEASQSALADKLEDNYRLRQELAIRKEAGDAE